MGNFSNKVRDVIERTDVPPLSARNNTVNITSESQLAPVSGGTRTLSSDTAFVFDGTVDVAEQLEFSQGTGIYGINWPTDQINYTGSGTLFHGTNVDIMLRNIVTMAPNGQLFDVSGTTDDRYLVQSSAFLMTDNLGVVDGFKVPGTKLCDFTNYNEGITHTGNPNKVYYTTCPFREVSNGTSLTFDSNFQTDFIQLDSLFFKTHNNNSDAINFDSSATLNDIGIVRGNIFDDTVQNRTVNFDQTTKGWKFTDNEGIEDSAVRGQYSLDSSTTTTINNQASSDTDEASYEKIAGSTTNRPGIERFTHSNNELTYDSVKDRDLEFQATVSLDGVNDQVAIAIFKNDSLITGSPMKITAQGATAVNVTTFAEENATDGDNFEIFIANLGSTSNINVLDMIVKGAF